MRNMDHHVENLQASLRTYALALQAFSLMPRKAEATPDENLADESTALVELAVAAQNTINAINSYSGHGDIDPEGQRQLLLEQGAEALRRHIETDTPNTAVRNAYIELYNLSYELRDTMMEHDADVSPVSGTFTTAEDLIDHLKAH